MPVSERSLPAHATNECGEMDYTDIGQADADLTSARMALDALLGRGDLTPAQRRDFAAALKATQRAARAVGRHIDYDLTA